MTNIDSRLRQQCSKLCNIVVGVLSLAPCYSEKNFELQVRRADQALYPIQSGSFVGRGPWLYATSPCKLVKNQWEVLHLFRWYTHTSHIARFDFGRASLAGSAIHQLKWTCRMLVYKAALTLFRGEIRRLLEYLDRVVEAHAINHLPRLVEFPRCRSSHQSVW